MKDRIQRWIPLLKFRKSTLMLFGIAAILNGLAFSYFIELSLLSIGFAKIPLLLGAIDIFDNAVFGQMDPIDEIKRGNVAVALVYGALYIMGGIILAPI